MEITESQKNKIISAVAEAVKNSEKLTLSTAKRLADKITEYAESIGKKLVIAIVNDQGRPILVEVMDGAFLVSYDVALKKAYSAVAVKMSTARLAKEVKAGGSLQGLETEGSLIFLGGGEPLYKNGKLIGAVAVSGGTAEEDTFYAKKALEFFNAL